MFFQVRIYQSDKFFEEKQTIPIRTASLEGLGLGLGPALGLDLDLDLDLDLALKAPSERKMPCTLSDVAQVCVPERSPMDAPRSLKAGFFLS